MSSSFLSLFLLSALYAVTLAVKVPLPPTRLAEGVTHLAGSLFLASDIPTGQILLVDVATSVTTVAVTPPQPRFALGLSAPDTKTVFVAGAGPIFRTLGQGFLPGIELPVANATLNVYDLPSGEEIASCMAPDGILVNDVTADADFAYFTETFAPRLYRLRRQALPRCVIDVIPLPAPLFSGAAPSANGIALFKTGLLITNFGAGALYFLDLSRDNRVAEVFAPGTLSSPDGIEVSRINGRNYLFIVQGGIDAVGVYRLGFVAKKGRVTVTFVRNFRRMRQFVGPTTVAVGGDFMTVTGLNTSAIEEDSTGFQLSLAVVPVSRAIA